MIGIAAAVSPGARTAAARSCANQAELGGATLGRVAYLRGSELHVVDLGSCRDRLLARNARPPVRFSPSGRWIAFGSARVVPAAGGAVRRPFPGAGGAWGWSPREDRLAAVTRRGGVLLGGPGRAPRRLRPDGWGAQSLAFAPDGTLAVARSPFARAGGSNVRQEIWSFRGPRLAPRLVFALRRGLGPPELATLSPDGRWVLFWLRAGNSNSLATDGLPLQATPVVGARAKRLGLTLLYRDFFAWCGERLVFAAGGDRYTTRGKRLVAVSPPAWRPRELSRDGGLSWVSPACSSDGRFVAAGAGRNYVEPRFGRESRSLWLLAVDGSSRRRLTTAPNAATSDEAPWFSGDGSVVLFWRTRADGRGRLYGVRADNADTYGPLADAGPVANYYGHYSWPDASDWFPG